MVMLLKTYAHRILTNKPRISFERISHLKSTQASPGWWGSVDWVPSCKPKDRRFDSQWGQVPALWARSLVEGVQKATTHWCFSPSFSLLSPLSKNKWIKYLLFKKHTIQIQFLVSRKFSNWSSSGVLATSQASWAPKKDKYQLASANTRLTWERLQHFVSFLAAAAMDTNSKGRKQREEYQMNGIRMPPQGRSSGEATAGVTRRSKALLSHTC